MNCDYFSGCVMGLLMGDAYGAPFEGGPIERLAWRCIGKTKTGHLRYTDDSQMALDLGKSFLQNRIINQDHLAQQFSNSYHWSRGYGPSAAKLLKKISKGTHWSLLNKSIHKQGSWGNGAAMRAPILALCYFDDEMAMTKAVIKASEITHAHPLAIDGAILIAWTTYAALHNKDTAFILSGLKERAETEGFKSRVGLCAELVCATQEASFVVIKSKLGNSITAEKSCLTAIYFALRYRTLSYSAMLSAICRLGGDTDTIGAMAGAIWGAFNGFDALDKNKAQKVEGYETFLLLSKQLHALVQKEQKQK